MKIRNLQLNFYKNHQHIELDTNVDVIGLYGANGVGKTNVLDALYFLCSGKSYFSGTDIQCINDDAASAGIIAKIGDADVKLILQRGRKKKIEKNGKAYTRILDYLGQYLCVVIAPADIELILGANALKRSFVNQILGQTDVEYLHDLVSYNRLIDQRNAHLKSDKPDEALLQVLDAQIHDPAHRIHQKRLELLEKLVPLVRDFYLEISDHKEQVDIEYISNLSNTEYKEAVLNFRRKDRVLQRSSVGIHKDEIDFKIENRGMKKYGSQGQIKSFLIALKLAEYSYYKAEGKKGIFLLLDDIFEKIDMSRAAALTGIIKSANFDQIFISDTESARIESFCKEIGREYKLFAING